MLLMIDNYDSFTYNLVQYFSELQANVTVYRHDDITIEEIRELKPSRIVISPGPCSPDQAGISMAVIKQFQHSLPILGVCLGHQSLAQVFGGRVVHAKQVMHGKTSMIYHHHDDIFHNINSPFIATRYHSLVVEKNSLPDCFTITAWTQDDDGNFDEIMAIKHQTLNLHGVQFHPESIMTDYGHQLLKNFLHC